MKFSTGHCRFPTGPDSVCGAPVPPRPGPGRPAAYCSDPAHNPVRAHRAAKRYAAAVDTPAEQTDAERLAAELAEARATIAVTERARHGAEREAHAARRERDAALALRDLAREEAAELRAEAADMRRNLVQRAAAVADAARVVKFRAPNKPGGRLGVAS